MALVDPRKKNDMLPTAIVRPDLAPSIGGGNPVGLSLAGIGGSSAPALTQPGTASPDVNPLPLGTQLGSALRSARRGTVNDQVGVLNTANKLGAGIANAATYLPRTILGGLRDTSRAALGMDPSPNAGQPVGGVPDAPVLQKPYAAAPVNFVAGGRAATAAGTTGARAAAAPVDNISAGNLATALRFPSKPAPGAQAAAPASNQLKQPGINSGVTVDGRTLPVGAMINGVPTFSDGSGAGPGAIPRTMDDKTIQHYGDNLSRADAGALGKVLAGDVAGSPVSTDQQVSNLVRNAVVPITGSRPSAEQFAAADRNAIALRDPRSAAGTAARNLSIDAQYGGTGTARRNASDALVQLTAGSNQAGLAAQQGENQQAIADQQGQNAIEQTTLQGRNQLANTALENKGRLQMPRSGQQVQLADGSLGIQDTTTGLITPSKLADGSVAKGLVTRDDSGTKRTNEIMDQLNKGVQEQMKAYLPTKDAPTPTKDMIAQWREQNAIALGLQLGTDSKTGKRVANINGQAVPL